jgi:hypothetical protein
MAYADVCHLQALLQLDRPSAVQTEAMQRCLDEAAAEIDWELGYDPIGNPAPDPPPPLVVGVNLDRAVEHWRQGYSAFGSLNVGQESVPVFMGLDTWQRHKLKLTPLKVHEGIA